EHFTFIDCNPPRRRRVGGPGGPEFPPGPAGGGGPGGGGPGSGGGGGPDGPSRPGDEDECEDEGSIVKCWSQGLVETAPLAGVPYSLSYDSRRHRASLRTVAIPLGGSEIPSDVSELVINARIAGKLHELSFPPTTDFTHDFEWDGLDVFGRQLIGTFPVDILACYVYPGIDYEVIERRNADNPDVPIFGDPPSDSSLVLGRPDGDGSSTAACRSYQQLLTSVSKGDVGDWTFDVHHTYDPVEHTLYQGDGMIRRGELRGLMAEDFAGVPSAEATSTDNTNTAKLRYRHFEIAPDGHILMSDPSAFSGVVDRAPDGSMSVVLDGNPFGPGEPVEVRDMAIDCEGRLLTLERRRILDGREIFQWADGTSGSSPLLFEMVVMQYDIDTDGRAILPGTVLAGGGTEVAEGVLARDAYIPAQNPPSTHPFQFTYNLPTKLHVGPECSVYFYEDDMGTPVNGVGRQRIRKVRSDGRIVDLIARERARPSAFSTGPWSSDHGPGIFAVAQDGTVYVYSWPDAVGPFGSSPGNPQSRITRIAPDGGPEVLATHDDFCPCSGSACPTTCAVTAMAVDDRNDTLYVGLEHREPTGPGAPIATRGRIVAIAPDGAVRQLLGSAQFNLFSLNHPWTTGPFVLWYPRDIEVGNDGYVYFSELRWDEGSPTTFLRRLRPPLPGSEWFDGNPIFPSSDGQEVFVFTPRGRHLETRDAFTGATRLQFEYDDVGALTGIVDAYANRTTVTRPTPGALPTSIVGPYGHVTGVVAQAGEMTELQSPTTEAPYRFTYHADSGLLATMTTPRDLTHSYDYNAEGRLVTDTGPDNRTVTLSRSESGSVTTVQKTESGAGTTTYTYDASDPDNVVRTVEFADGSQNVAVQEPNGTSVLTSADGTMVTTRLEPDPVHGLLDPIRQTTTTLPSGLERVETVARTTTGVETGEDPFFWATRTTTRTVNGRASALMEDRTARNATTASPAARTTSTSFDQHGRPISAAAGSRDPIGFAYDSAGRLASTTFGTGQSARATTYTYYADQGTDENGYLMSVDGPLANDVWTVQPDAWGRTVDQERPDGEHTTFDYDGEGNMTSVKPPGQEAHQLGYTPFDAIANYAAPPAQAGGASAVMTTDYTLAREPDLITDAEQRTIDNTYDPATGRLTSSATAAASISRSYDAQGRVSQLQRTDAQGLHTLTFEYDGSL
ncbi:MAG: hypothetical protein OXR73_29530, partial [Myxococcales bacterium]|nr:hypothetical protein [Myxococcales bacterium]